MPNDDAYRAEAALPLPGAMCWITLIFRGVIRAGVKLGVVLTISNYSGFAPCNHSACPYFGLFPRQQQPSIFSLDSCSITGMLFMNCFSAVQNGEQPDFAGFQWKHRSKTSEIHSFCESPQMVSSVINDLMWQPSQITLVASILVGQILAVLHDTLLLLDYRELLAQHVGIVSFLCDCCVAVSGILWGMGLSETFVAPVPEGDADEGCLCFYSVPTLPMLLTLGSVFVLLSTPFLRLKSAIRAVHFGEFLYNVQHEVAFRSIRSAVQDRLMTDASSSMLIPRLPGDRGAPEILGAPATQGSIVYLPKKVLAPESECEAATLIDMDQRFTVGSSVAKGYPYFRGKSFDSETIYVVPGGSVITGQDDGGEWVKTTVVNFPANKWTIVRRIFQTSLACLLFVWRWPHPDYIAVDVVSMAVGTIMVAYLSTWRPSAWLFLGNCGGLMNKVCSICCRKDNVGANVAPMGPNVLALCSIGTWFTTVCAACFMAPILARAGFLLMEWVPALGPKGCTPDRASDLASNGRVLCLWFIITYQVYTIKQCNDYLLSVPDKYCTEARSDGSATFEDTDGPREHDGA